MADGDARARSWTRATVSSVAAIVASAAFVVLATRLSADSTSARLSLAPGDADADAVARSVVDPFCDARSGHLAPSVFLLGVEKCGTSSLFEDMTASLPALRKMHARVGDHWEQHKEMRYFDTDGRFVNYGAPDLHVGLGWSDWLRGHGDACDAVVGDVRRAAGAAPSSSGSLPPSGAFRTNTSTARRRTSRAASPRRWRARTTRRWSPPAARPRSRRFGLWC